MSTLTEPLRHHHKHCDELFVSAEAAVIDKDWTTAAQLLPGFLAEMEAHFRTEEEMLFPAFEAATGMTMGPTRMMRVEHAQMRELFGQMRAALTHRDARDFAGVAETLLVLMQQHNMKEENILYPMCDRGLDVQSGELEPVLRERLGAACPTTC
ncbi:MAG: hemerythrin domain-containing protein [Pseudomonadota bacterium]